MVKEEGNIEMGSFINVGIYRQFSALPPPKIIAFEVGRGARVNTTETRICFRVQEVGSKLLKSRPGGFYLPICYTSF